jgi:hypothetical protein
VCCSAAIEMQQLGISTKKDMAKLRSECANYGIRKPQMSQSKCGPPKFMILKDVLENLIDGISNIVLCDAAILKKNPNNANIAAKT